MKYLLLAATLVVLAACSNKPTTTSSDQAENISRAQDRAWFCQMDESGNDWQCVQDAQLVRNPQPDRLPSRKSASDPLEPGAALSMNQSSIREDATPEVIPEPAKVAASEPVVPADMDLPLHIALSYRPAQPVALMDLPADYFAVQLVAVSQKEDLEKFAEQHQIRGMSAARTYSQDQLFYILLLGVYETYDYAEQAASSLGPPFDTAEPWIRPMGSLQRAMRAADKFAGSSDL